MVNKKKLWGPFANFPPQRTRRGEQHFLFCHSRESGNPLVFHERSKTPGFRVKPGMTETDWASPKRVCAKGRFDKKMNEVKWIPAFAGMTKRKT
jgi:hypothetical protein